jgi:hypothetical protein
LESEQVPKTNTSDDPQTQAQSARGGFFAVDSRTWAWVCRHGMNAAVAYLVQARGTGPNNRTTAWSTNAIETYTGISRHRARDAIAKLVAIGAGRQVKGGTRPSYYLVPAHEIAGLDPRQPLDGLESFAVWKVKHGELLAGASDFQYARNAVNKGWLKEERNCQFTLAPEPKPEPDWIWVPNELVTGADNEVPPVELLRQTQDVMLLGLLIDFYGAQNLCEDGGIGKQFTHKIYKRFKVGQQGQYIVWGFRLGQTWVNWLGPTLCHYRKLTAEEQAAGATPGDYYFRRLDQLVRLGLIQWTPHLFESDSEDAEIVHPVGIGRSDSIEDQIGLAAHEAGHRLLTSGQSDWAEEQKLWLVPVLSHIAEAQLFGIARLRYRPHTAMTAAWWAELNETGERLIRLFDSLGAPNASIKAA